MGIRTGKRYVIFANSAIQVNLLALTKSEISKYIFLVYLVIGNLIKFNVGCQLSWQSASLAWTRPGVQFPDNPNFYLCQQDEVPSLIASVFMYCLQKIQNLNNQN
ncbi:Hypothetical_protein [Hexamita inflata]|uniref:Hypothetical_protein n=1 Tax=Hexamita inflata TaxID=28002 RepID=A0AA86TTW5_9EUKA|nr:Hypothetical protein HINF_LOCUS9558 [Hexamita inflata]